jgi:hypothetical protein
MGEGNHWNAHSNVSLLAEPIRMSEGTPEESWKMAAVPNEVGLLPVRIISGEFHGGDWARAGRVKNSITASRRKTRVVVFMAIYFTEMYAE